MRALDNDESAENIVDGFKIYCNFLRPHMSLNKKSQLKLLGCLELESNRWRGVHKEKSRNSKVYGKNLTHKIIFIILPFSFNFSDSLNCQLITEIVNHNLRGAPSK